MEPITFLVMAGLAVGGLVCKWLDRRTERRRKNRLLDQIVDDCWVDIVAPKKSCKHPEDKLIPIHSDAFEKNGLVATLCLDCDGQLDAKVWRDKMGRELAAFEKEQAKIELDQKIAASLAADSPETLYDSLELARQEIYNHTQIAALSNTNTDWDAIKAARSVANTYVAELKRRGLPDDRLLYESAPKSVADTIRDRQRVKAGLITSDLPEVAVIRSFGIPDPIRVDGEYVPGVRPAGRPQEQYWSEFKAAGFMLKDEYSCAFDGSVTQFLHHPRRGVYGVKFPALRELQRWMEL